MKANQASEEPQRRRPGGRTARNSDRIRRATIAALERGGYASLSFAAVAEEAGVNRTTLHRRFQSRADLALHAMRQSVRELVVFEDLGSLRADLRGALSRIGELISGPLGATLFIALVEMQQRGEFESGLGWHERLDDVTPMFDRAVARGEVSAEIDREATFALLAGALYFRVIVMGEPVDEAWIERTLDVYFDEPRAGSRRR